MTTLRILKAFAWMRWRMLVNSLEHTGSRDALERFSLAIEKLAPILAAVLLIPSAIFMAGLGLAAGYLLASGGSLTAFSATRFILIAAPLLAIIGPFFLPAADRTNPVRLLLLPISRSTLYIAQSSAAFGDPWNALLVPLLFGVPVGILAAGDLVSGHQPSPSDRPRPAPRRAGGPDLHRRGSRHRDAAGIDRRQPARPRSRP
jgi:hypothetical protein